MSNAGNTASWDIIEVIPYPLHRRWVWHEERHVTYRRGRRGPHRGRVQALVQDAQRKRP